MTQVTAVENWYKEKWAEQVIIKYQARGYTLKDTTEPPVRIEGRKFHFLRTGDIEAQQYHKGDTVSALNPDDDTVEIEATEWDAAVHIYDWDRTRSAAREEDVRQEQCNRALGRRSDILTYDPIMAAALPASQIIGDYADPMNPYLLMQAYDILFDNDVETDMGIFCPLPSKAFRQCETYKIFSNSEWTGGDLPLTKMVKRKTFEEGHCFMLPPHLKNRYVQNGNELRFRIWAKSAVGSGHNEDIRNEWEREAKKKRWFVNHTLDGAAVVLQTKGIVEIRMNADSIIEGEIVKTKEQP